MVEVIKFRNKEKMHEQASDWIVRLEKPDIGEDDIQELLVWLEESPNHRTEFLELISVWGNMDILSELAELIPLENWQPKYSENPGVANIRWRPVLVTVASICITLSLGIFAVKDKLWIGTSLSEPVINQVYVTSVGDQHSIDLTDGSNIKLNTNSSVKVDYTNDFRNIYLEYGEVYFDVKHDLERPFVVHVGQGSVTAVGTAFNIKYEDQIVGVTVTDGVVDVSTSLAESAATTLLSGKSAEKRKITKTSISAGQTVEFDEVIRLVDSVEPEEIDHELAWRRGMLIFDGDYLEDAVSEIARYTNTKIVINDQAIRKVRIGGYFRTGEIEGMLKAFESSFGIAVNRVSDDLIVLSKQPDFDVE